MKQLLSEIKYFTQNKTYMILVGLTALFSYGFMISRYTIGIDDTATLLYFKEGIAPSMGRWCLYLISKVIQIAKFSPWITELAGILILILSITIWCVLFRRIMGDQLPIWGYAAFSGIFLSCPIHSEVFVYYLHNGICLGYGFTALSLLALLSSMKKENSRKNTIQYMFLAIGGLVISIGFYESFLVVYVIGMIMMFYLLRLKNGKIQNTSIFKLKISSWGGMLAAVSIVTIVFRSVILKVLELIFRFSIPDNYSVAYRSLFSELVQNISNRDELIMALKKWWVMYYVNAIVYLPITIFVLAMFVLGVHSVVHGIKKKDMMLFVCLVLIAIIPVLMTIVEGYPTHYRASQYLPLVCAFAVLLLFWEWNKLKRPKWKGVSFVAAAALCCLIYNQCADMNQWFYIDYLKYEDAKNTMNLIAYELKKDHDISKPIIFGGAYLVPYEIVKDAYCSYTSKEYRWISRITDIVDVHLKEKFHAEGSRGYVFAQTPNNSTLRWGVSAFNGTSWQLIEFWKMHGHSFRAETDLSKIEEAEQLRLSMPGFPKEGSIVEYAEYILVNFGD